MYKTARKNVSNVETIDIDKVKNDWTLVAAICHPNYETSLPVKLHATIFNAIHSLVDARGHEPGSWRELTESSNQSRSDMGRLAGIMLENVGIKQFTIRKVR